MVAILNLGLSLKFLCYLSLRKGLASVSFKIVALRSLTKPYLAATILNSSSNGELSDPLCDSVNSGLTLVKLARLATKCEIWDLYISVINNF